MGKFEVTYSVCRLYSTVVDAKDKEEALELVRCGRGGENADVVEEEFLGVNIATDVTHDLTGKTDNKRKG